ncbi:hypothetical protein AMECASPLE_014371 [Ameca splendens]|uniref:Uncharacterized protein n=1 Tax=Ameca splendens TaxID=208324 RepID=A0ABV0ZXY5_9TELE
MDVELPFDSPFGRQPQVPQHKGPPGDHSGHTQRKQNSWFHKLQQVIHVLKQQRSNIWPDSVFRCYTFLEGGISQASASNNLMLTFY